MFYTMMNFWLGTRPNYLRLDTFQEVNWILSKMKKFNAKNAKKEQI